MHIYHKNQNIICKLFCYRLLEKMIRSLELPRVKDSGLVDIELQEEASLGLECGNGQMDLASHLQTGVE